MPSSDTLTAEQEADRRIGLACDALVKIIHENRNDWMLERPEFLAVLASVAAGLVAEIVADPRLQQRLSDADERFIAAFRMLFQKNMEALSQRRFL